MFWTNFFRTLLYIHKQKLYAYDMAVCRIRSGVGKIIRFVGWNPPPLTGDGGPIHDFETGAHTPLDGRGLHATNPINFGGLCVKYVLMLLRKKYCWRIYLFCRKWILNIFWRKKKKKKKKIFQKKFVFQFFPNKK